MEDAGIGSRNTLVKVIQELENFGWLKVVKKKHHNNQYKNNRYSVQVPNVTIPCIISDEAIVKSDTLKINKDKRKINKSGIISWKHTSISTLPGSLLPVSGIVKGEL
jgi:hypothetical protein